MSGHRTRIKFCGMTRVEDVRLACELGVDAIGLVFAGNGPRRLDGSVARRLREAVSPMVDVVALFMDSDPDEIRKVLELVRPTLLQFHGREDDAACRRFGVRYLKAIPMGNADRPGRLLQPSDFPGAAGFVFDSHAAGAPGGSGRPFDWRRLPAGLDRPSLLAGGLDPDNVLEAIATAQPWGVDVSSGIESAPGIKDPERMQRFVREVRRADDRAR